MMSSFERTITVLDENRTVTLYFSKDARVVILHDESRSVLLSESDTPSSRTVLVEESY